MLDFDIDEKPQEFLIEEYQKFPLHIKVKINQTPSQFFNYRGLFTPSNVNSIEMLSKAFDLVKAKRLIFTQMAFQFVSTEKEVNLIDNSLHHGRCLLVLLLTHQLQSTQIW